MADITAKMVNELRAKSGQGMMECKKALTETGGDVEKAIDYFRKKGVKTSILSREAKEGRIGTALTGDGKTAVAVEVLCNTDFTGKSEPMAKIVAAGTKLLLSNSAAKVAEDPAIKELVTQAAQQTGENVQVGRTQVLSNPGGKVGAYQHYTGKIVVLVSFSGSPSEELIKDVCLHIAGHNPPPLALTREGVPADLVAREREIAVEQAKATGKPQQIAEKIAEGKMRTFYEERVLLDQKFVKDDSKTVAQLVQAAGVKLEKYVRLEVGQ
jgi:elongation factor Ts